jgi:hypothetical protein
MIEIIGNDISELNDGDLRSLIGLLCEAELRDIGLPTAGVTWGGHQNAKDGGIDVKVELTHVLHEDNFIPRSITGFQVKKPDMPRASILKEMQSGGKIKQVIKDLADASGAYIIVSSQGSTSDLALKSRRDAMKEALSGYPNAAKIKVDFYDRERIAGWVRNYPSLILWIRDKIGKPIQGWRSYGNWARSFMGDRDQYLLDGNIRLHNSSRYSLDGLTAIDGINELRTILHQPASSVRLVGLSGVGKTRLLQALFDERIGEKPLNQSQVFYSDISDSPNPDPRNYAERILALRKPAILAIDNCPPELHRGLTSICSTPGSLVSLITIEYDVREDQPEETEVFRLEPASNELIEKLITARFDYVSQVDARTIAEFSGGNARIAIALANTVQKGENVTDLKDNQLFLRLFHQRNEPDSYLLKVAEVCSLVYSFDCQTKEGTDGELKLLGSLIGMNVGEIYKNVSELKRRDLVQQRNIWRAILPQAIANKLAKRALENIPLNDIYSSFEKCDSERLLTSFSRRLGYLHESEAAIEISKRWFSENGLLDDISNLDGFGVKLLCNIAPVNPEATLSAIEKVSNQVDAQRFFSRNNDYYIEYTQLLRSLAYEESLFERCTKLLCRFALTEKPGENDNSIMKLLESLFYLYLSGTHASPAQRLKIIAYLIEADSVDYRELGICLLGASLEARDFTSYHEFEFGARSRDYGYSPRSKEDVRKWYKLFINYAVNIAVSNLPAVTRVKAILGEQFRALWTQAEMYDELELAAKEISSKSSWHEGWLGVKSIKKYDNEDMDPIVISRINYLDLMLAPSTLIDKAKLYALYRYSDVLDVVDVIENQSEELGDEYLQVENITRTLGSQVGAQNDVFMEMLPDILSNDGARLFSFGQGLAVGCTNHRTMWNEFCEQLSLIDESRRDYKVLCGFLNAIAEENMEFAELLLNESLENKILAPIYPIIQTSIEISPQGVERLKRSLEFDLAPIQLYRNLAYVRVCESINDTDICELLILISSKQEGIEVAINIFSRRLHFYAKGNVISETIIYCGQELLLKYEFTERVKRNDRIDYEVGNVIKVCFADRSAGDNARTVCSRLAELFAKYKGYLMNYGYVLEALAAVQPLVFLDVFLAGDVRFMRRIKRIFSDGVGLRPNPMNKISDDIIISWCEVNPQARYQVIAFIIMPYKGGKNVATLDWTPLALKIISNSSDPTEVLNEFKSTFRPMSWSGSLVGIMKTRLKLISDLKRHENPFVVDWAHKNEVIFEEEIRQVDEWESKREREKNESFE